MNKGTLVAHRRGKQYRLSDFDDHFPKGWNTLYDKHSDGCTVDFPIIMLPSIKYGPRHYMKESDGSAKELPRLFSEIASVTLLKKRC